MDCLIYNEKDNIKNIETTRTIPTGVKKDEEKKEKMQGKIIKDNRYRN